MQNFANAIKLGMPKQNKRYAVLFICWGVNGRAEESFSVKACYRSGLLLQFNFIESSSGKVFEKFGSMKPIVREVCADSSNSNKFVILEWILED